MLDFLAGYISFKIHSVNPMLECSTAQASDELLKSVPSSWISVISRGELYVPHPWWMVVVEEFNDGYKSIIGSVFLSTAAHRSPPVAGRAQPNPGLDHRIARRLARVRLYMRIGKLCL